MAKRKKKNNNGIIIGSVVAGIGVLALLFWPKSASASESSTPSLPQPTPQPSPSSTSTINYLTQKTSDITPQYVNPLRRGAKGKAVAFLENFLKVLGYYKGAIDGDFGPGLEAAVKAFQATTAENENGLVYYNTMTAIINEYNKRSTTPIDIITAITIGGSIVNGTSNIYYI